MSAPVTDLTDAMIAELRGLAERATPGPWQREDGELLVWSREGDINGTPLVRAESAYRRWGRELKWDDHAANMDFVAAANPARALALLDALVAAREAIQEIIRLEDTFELLLRDPGDNHDLTNAIDAARAALPQARAAEEG